MGYTTEFEGTLSIEPRLTPEQAQEINEFCERRQCRSDDHNRPPDGMPGLWCDWETDGTSIYWNGSEKSYYMFEWLLYLNEHFFKPWGCVLTGEIAAQGEDRGDVWGIAADEGNIHKLKGKWTFERLE